MLAGSRQWRRQDVLASPAPWSAAGWVSRKPMIRFQNHMVEQFATDVYRFYPGAINWLPAKGL